MPILMNHWYVACTRHELAERPLGRDICNEAVVLYRGTSGTAHALRDLCPHRKAPLSMGRIEGDALRCAYHGMRFASDGRCDHIPSQDAIPRQACVRAFPVQERYGLVWIWPGDPALAEAQPLPARPWLEQPDWNHDVLQHFPVRAAYTLMGDNLLDLSHVAFLHGTSIGFDPRRLENDPLQMRIVEGEVINERIFENTEQAPAHRAWHAFPGKVRRVQRSAWSAPANVTVLVRNEAEGVQVDLRADHFITPATHDSHHYFIAVSRNFRIEDAELSAKLDAGTRAVHLEDVAIAEAQQRMNQRYPEVKEVALRADRAITAAHRMLDQLASREAPSSRQVAATAEATS